MKHHAEMLAWYQVHVYKISVGVKSVSPEKITSLEKSTSIEISGLRRNNRVKVTINIHTCTLFLNRDACNIHVPPLL